METGQLEAFVKVAQSGSFTRAAKELGLTQPSVSTRVAVLEAELGSKLFERRGRRLSLTLTGETLLPYVERALLALQEGKQVVSDLQGGRRGRVALVALDTLATTLLPEPMQRFRREYPEVDFAVSLSMPREILNLLYEGTVQLGLISGPLWDRGVQVLARFQEPVHAFVSTNHPLAQQSEVTLADVLNHTIMRVPLNPTTTAFVEHLIEQTRSQGGSTRLKVPMVMVIPLLLGSHGVAFLPTTFVRQHLEQGELAVLRLGDLPHLYYEALLVKLEACDLDLLHQEFVRMVRARWRRIQKEVQAT